MSRAVIKALIATVLFASVPACIRASHMDSIALGIVRLALAGLGMSAIMIARRRSPWKTFAAEVWRWRLVLVAVGVFFGLHWLCYFLSIKHASASIGVLGFCTYGAQLPLLGWALGFGRPSAAALVGVVLGLLGAVLCLPSNAWTGADAVGLGIAVLSGTFYAVLPLIHQRYAHLDHELRTWAQFCFALPVFMPLAGQATWAWSGQEALLTVHMGLIVTLVGHYLWVQATTELPIQTTSLLSYLQLPTTLAMNVLLAGDRMTARMLWGAGLIVAANVVTLGKKAATGEELAAEKLGESRD